MTTEPNQEVMKLAEERVSPEIEEAVEIVKEARIKADFESPIGEGFVKLVTRREAHLLAEIAAALAQARQEGAAKERIICAAVLLDGGKFVVGNFHGCCFAAQRTFFPDTKEAQQGFVTSLRRFVGREEALVIANAAGQVVKKHTPLDQLLSEDLESLSTNSQLAAKNINSPEVGE